mmetsp:Transcript_16464/g.26987  ORF Transcript_16464/g.26987 Transcript_16464/m.26987 type:complete len:239 (+) Transcript_16464:362-1078(+)
MVLRLVPAICAGIPDHLRYYSILCSGLAAGRVYCEWSLTDADNVQVLNYNGSFVVSANSQVFLHCMLIDKERALWKLKDVTAVKARTSLDDGDDLSAQHAFFLPSDAITYDDETQSICLVNIPFLTPPIPDSPRPITSRQQAAPDDSSPLDKWIASLYQTTLPFELELKRTCWASHFFRLVGMNPVDVAVAHTLDTVRAYFPRLEGRMDNVVRALPESLRPLAKFTGRATCGWVKVEP